MKLFRPDAIFIGDETTKDHLFKTIADELLDKGYVKSEFYEKIVEREKNYPTGMDISVIDKNLPHIAIPHTESEYVNETMIVPIKLNNAVEFNNMINPEEVLDVTFLFMILNDQKESQSSILAAIMDFLNNSNSEELKMFFNYESKDDIYNYLNEKFISQL